MSERDEFATRRRKQQDEFSEELVPLVKAAILTEDWSAVLAKVVSLYTDLYAGETQMVAATGDGTELDRLLIALRENFRHVKDDSDAEAISLVIALGVMNAATAAMVGDRQGVVQEWVTMHDNKVREAHEEADGQQRPVGENFDIGGYPMPYPGWPSAPVSLWINCRCVLRPVEANQFAENSEKMGQTSQEPVQAGGKMTVTEEPVDEQIEDEESDDAEMAIAVPWHGVLAPEGIKSGDGRMFAEGSLRNRDLPLPLTWQKVSADGHNQNITVAKIERMQKIDGLVHASGHFLSIPEADEAIGLLAEFGKYGVSVDADEAVAEYSEDEVLTFSDARISAACIVSIPAFAEAYVSLGPHPVLDAEPDQEALLVEEVAALERQLTVGAKMNETADRLGFSPVDVTPVQERLAVAQAALANFREVSTEERKRLADDDKAMDDGSYPIANCEDLSNAIQAIGRAKDPEATKRHIRKRAAALQCPDVEIPDTWAKTGIESGELVTAGRGPGWVTNPEGTRRLHAYWTRGKGAAKIRWGQGGDFNRCRRLVGQEIAANSPEDMRFLNQICAQWHHDALGIWPGEHDAAGEVVNGTAAQLSGEPAPAISLSAAGGWCAPSEWFEDPKLQKPTSMQFYTDERGTRVFGHLAEWGVCHIGIDGVCTVAPPSMTNYAYFALGQIDTDAGPVRVGNLTIGTGHAALRLGARPAAAHYDDTGTVWADVAIGEDEFGIWYSGWVRPNISEETLYAAKASGKVSGDWREIVRGSGELELVAALSVNVEGFQKIQPQVGIAAGGQISLVAAGMVTATNEGRVKVNLGLSEDDKAEIAAAVVEKIESRVQAKRDKENRIKELRSRLQDEE